MLNSIKNIPLRILLSLSSAFAIFCFIVTTFISQNLLSEVDINTDHVNDFIALNNTLKEFQDLQDISRMKVIYALGFYERLDEMVRVNKENFTQVQKSYNSLISTDNSAVTPEVKQALEKFIRNYQEYLQDAEKLREQRLKIVEIYDATSWITTDIKEADALVTQNRNAADLQQWNQRITQMADTAGLMLFNIAEGVKGQSRTATQKTLGEAQSLIAQLQPFENWPETKDLVKNARLWVQQLKDILQLQNEKIANADRMVSLGNENTNLISKLALISSQKTEQLSDRTSDLLESVTTSQLTATGIAILLSLTISFLLSNAISSIMRTLYLTVKDLADGNLTSRTGIKGTNEIGLLGVSLDEAMSQLSTTARALRGVSDEVATSSTELAAVMTQSEVNGQEQQQQVEQIAAAVTELSVAAKQVDGYAKTADESAQQALALGAEGATIAEQSRQLSQELSIQLNETSSQVTELNEQSIKIGEVITVIDSISDQTNLLALNAAIEAARAGESGRGFAVVADEVRVLAGKTQDSTQQIKTIIEQLQQKSSEVVSAVNNSLDKVKSNNEIAAQTSQQINSISDALTHISQVNGDVTTSVDEQSRAITEITQNINNINDIISQNVAGISQSAEASNHLSQQAEEQKKRLSLFQIEQ